MCPEKLLQHNGNVPASELKNVCPEKLLQHNGNVPASELRNVWLAEAAKARWQMNVHAEAAKLLNLYLTRELAQLEPVAAG